MALTANVVDGQIILAAWGNEIRDRTMQTFTNKAALDAWAAPAGSVAVTLDNNVQWRRIGTAWVPYPGSEFVYTQITANATIVATTATSAATVIDTGSVTYPAGNLIVSFYTPSMSTPSQANAYFNINLWDGSTDLGYLGQVVNPGTAVAAAISMQRRVTVTAGTHQFIIKSWVQVGTGTITAGTGMIGAFAPAFARVTAA